MDQQRRDGICEATSARLAKAVGGLPGLHAVIGLDGFVDEIIAVVDKRHADGRFDPIRTIGVLGEKIRRAAGDSSNYELVVKQQKLGGNGPIMANALASLRLNVTYIGALGYPGLHPVFQHFAGNANVISVAEPGHTDALEFDDGKLMFGKYESLNDVGWANLVDRVGKVALQREVDRATLIGLVNWTMLPHMSEIWDHLREEILPAAPAAPRTLFIDLADPEKRTHEDIGAALKLLTRFQERIEVILGLNLKEAVEVAEVLGLPVGADPESSIAALASAIRAALDLGCVVIHPRRAAAAATRTESAEFAGPFVQQPRISTGAGDHFNAGFCLGRILGLDLDESLCAGVACSGYYVRSGQSPSAAQLAEFIAELPPPEG